MRPADGAGVAVRPPAVLARGGSFGGLPGPVQVMLTRRRWRRARPLRAWLAQAPGMDLVARARYAAPGMAHVSDLYLAQDVFRRPWGFLHVASTGHGSVVLDCDLGGLDLSDQDTAEQWIAELGLWLAMLTHEPDLAACTVTLDRPGVPADAHGAPSAGLGQATARPGARIQLTYRTLGPHGRTDAHAVATEVGARIPHLATSLRTAGIATARAAVPASIAAAVHDAYYGPGAGRAEVTAATAQEDWGVLRHGRPVGTARTTASITWSLIHLTSAVVLSQALPQVLLASTEHVGTRVSLIYQRRSPAGPQDDGQTWSGLPPSLEGSNATMLDATVGGGAPRFAMLVTTTSDMADLRAASRGLTDRLDAPLRPWLRPLYGAQAAGFAAGLPLGLVLSRHAGRARPLVDAARSSARPPSRGTTAGRSA
jgi:hypothetical protein